jgi:hypothetical protein
MLSRDEIMTVPGMCQRHRLYVAAFGPTENYAGSDYTHGVYWIRNHGSNVQT